MAKKKNVTNDPTGQPDFSGPGRNAGRPPEDLSGVPSNDDDPWIYNPDPGDDHPDTGKRKRKFNRDGSKRLKDSVKLGKLLDERYLSSYYDDDNDDVNVQPQEYKQYFGFMITWFRRGYVGGAMVSNPITRPGLVYYIFVLHAYEGILIRQAVVLRRQLSYNMRPAGPNPWLMVVDRLASRLANHYGDETPRLMTNSLPGLVIVIAPGGRGKTLLINGLANMANQLIRRGEYVLAGVEGASVVPMGEREGGGDGSPELETYVINTALFGDRLFVADSERLRFLEGSLIGSGGVPKDFGELATAVQQSFIHVGRTMVIVVNPMIIAPDDESDRSKAVSDYRNAMAQAHHGMFASAAATIMIDQFTAHAEHGRYRLSVSSAPLARTPVEVVIDIPYAVTGATEMILFYEE